MPDDTTRNITNDMTDVTTDATSDAPFDRPGDPFEPTASQKPIHIGEDLYGISVLELRERVAILRAEIVRCENEMGKKQNDLTAAHDIFKTKPL